MTKIHFPTSLPLHLSMPEEKKYSALEVSESSKKAVQLTTSGDIEGYFLSKELALPIILAEDDFMQSLSDFDCQLRKAKNKEDYRKHYAKQILEWAPEEIANLDEILERVKQKLSKYKITLPKTVNFIKTTGEEELSGTWAYCRKNTIVICNVSGITEELLTHELFHIHSQVDPNNRGRLYELIGFHSCNSVELPASLAKMRVINPDSPLLNSYVEVTYKGEKVKAIPLDVYEEKRTTPSGGSTFLPRIFHKFVVIEEDESGIMRCVEDLEGNPITFDLKEASDFKDQIGENTAYIDSPEEIIADNFKILIQNSRARTPGLIDRMKKIFTEVASTISMPQANPNDKYESQVPDAISVQLQKIKIEQELSENLQATQNLEEKTLVTQSSLKPQEFDPQAQNKETHEKQSVSVMKSNSREVEINLQEIHPKSALDVLNMPPKRKIEVQSKNPLENISQSEKTSITLKGVNESASGKNVEEVQKPKSRIEDASKQQKNQQL